MKDKFGWMGVMKAAEGEAPEAGGAKCETPKGESKGDAGKGDEPKDESKEETPKKVLDAQARAGLVSRIAARVKTSGQNADEAAQARADLKQVQGELEAMTARATEAEAEVTRMAQVLSDVEGELEERDKKLKPLGEAVADKVASLGIKEDEAPEGAAKGDATSLEDLRTQLRDETDPAKQRALHAKIKEARWKD